MLKIILETESKKYSLSGFNIGSYNRGSEHEPYPGDNTLVIYMKSDKIDQFLWDWFYNNATVKKDGKITVQNIEEEVVIQTVTFKEGYCNSLNSNLHVQDNYGSESNFTLIAKKISIQTGKTVSQKDERFI